MAIALDAEERKLFGQYSRTLSLWSRRYNTAEIVGIIGEPEYLVARWITHWRELSRGTANAPR